MFSPSVITVNLSSSANADLPDINLSIKEIEIDDEKKTLSKYGSSDSGASLGDILGSVIKKKNNA